MRVRQTVSSQLIGSSSLVIRGRPHLVASTVAMAGRPVTGRQGGPGGMPPRSALRTGANREINYSGVGLNTKVNVARAARRCDAKALP